MEAIAYERATTVDEAVKAAREPGVAYIGGGTNLLDLMKGGVAHPLKLIDITHLRDDGLDTVQPLPSGGIRIGA